MKTLKWQWWAIGNFFVFLVFAITIFVFPPSHAEGQAVEDNQTAPPPTTAIDCRGDALARQEAVRQKFVEEVEKSSFEAEGVSFLIDENGCLYQLVSKFSDKLKTPQTQARILVFLHTDKEFKIYRDFGAQVFIEAVLRSDEVLVKAFVVTVAVGDKRAPIIIFVKTGSLLVDT